ncbi:MAG: DNA methylase [Bacteroidales bacterium]|nr:DNA methylase [Bacteroidales bacterium]
MENQHTYIAIDLKSFYASAECVSLGLDPLTTNLVVADTSRTDKTICLAVSPSLKAYGIPGRARLFEVIQRVKQINYERKRKAGIKQFSGKSCNADELRQHPDWQLDYIAATPRMAYYIEVSTQVYNTYLQYIAPEDIHVYSIDEVFMDVTSYMRLYKMSAHELAIQMVRSVLQRTGITATAGIGSNMYLCKIAMDIEAKHMPADKDGVRIAELDEISYRQKLWNHRPLTDFWRVGRGTAAKLAALGIDTMGKIARLSLQHEELLYRMFGINAELLIDHAWGWEPCTMDLVKSYRPETNSMSSGQVLQSPYTYEKARIVVEEMADSVALQLVDKRLVTQKMTLTIGYDRESLQRPEIRAKYHGEIRIDHYGREVPKYAHGTATLREPSSSSRMIIDAILDLYDRITNHWLLVRRITIAANIAIEHPSATTDNQPVQLDLFTDYQQQKQQEAARKEALDKERRMQEARLAIKHRFGQNAILKGLNFGDGATAIQRNQQIGGHKA